jgi:hypothetical protein
MRVSALKSRPFDCVRERLGKRNEKHYRSSTGLKARLEVDLDKAAETG